MAVLLRNDTESSFPVSHSANSFLPDDAASTCPLLTPSPPTNALVNPAAEPEAEDFISAAHLASKLQGVQDDNTEGGDSISSSSSAEPQSSQLLTGHKAYIHHITKNEDSAAQETNGKTQALQMTFRNPAEHYFFMTWNWELIRKLTTWVFLSAFVAMIGIVVAMLWTMPKICNPPTQWYQGKLMYEIFPASFSDSNGDGIGDLRGIATRLDYIESIGVKAIRLNSIFRAWNYPEDYENVTSLTSIAPELGNLSDFANLINSAHVRSIYLTLDLPVTKYSYEDSDGSTNEVHSDAVADALLHWCRLEVDGFYLKGLENLVELPNFQGLLRGWKRIIGPKRIFLASYKVIEDATPQKLATIMDNVDLIDYVLRMGDGVEAVSGQIESLLNGTLFTNPGYPWVHWSLGNNKVERVSSLLKSKNGSLGALLLELMLPGTPSIFYGDEVGLQQVSDPHEDRKRLAHLHQLAAMAWEQPNKPFTTKGILPWIHGPPGQVHFGQVEVLSKMVALRMSSPSIYVNGIKKDGVNRANAEIKYKENDLLVMQRWYPRRKSYVVVSNLGCVHISADLSTLLYSGEVVVGPGVDSTLQSVTFRDISLSPGETVIVLLD